MGAAPLSVTVPITGFPPITEVGFKVSVERSAAITFRVSEAVTPLYVAEILKGPLSAATDVVVIEKVAEVELAGIVKLAGTVAAAFALDRLTAAPPPGALPLSVTVPMETTPPMTLAGLTTSLERVATCTVSGAVRVTPW